MTHDFVVAQDAAYNEMYFEQAAPSILQVPGAKDVSIEFHSLSKTFNMTGWRVGFAIGGAPLISALGQVKANVDSGVFTAIQFAGKSALDDYYNLTPPIRALYKERRDAFVGAMTRHRLGCSRAPGNLLCVDALPQGIYLGRVVHATARRGRRRHHAGHRLRPNRRRLHPRRLDGRNAPVARGRRANRHAQAVRVPSVGSDHVLIPRTDWSG